MSFPRKPVVLVDIDDTLASQHDAVISFMTQELNFVHTGPTGPEDKHWNPITWFNAHPDEIVAVFEEHGKTILRHAPVVAGAREALEALAEDFTLVGCTGRRPVYTETTELWARDYMPGLLSAIEFVNKPNGVSLPKTAVADKYSALTLVDDLPFFLADFVDEGRHAVYLNHGYSWQIDIDSPTIDIAESWSDAVSIINNLSNYR